MKKLSLLIIAILLQLNVTSQVSVSSTVRIPSQAGNAGKYLKTDGTKLLFGTPPGGSSVWGSITGTLSSQTDLQNELDNKLNLIDFPAQFSIELDGKTTADLAPSTDRNYVTDAQLNNISKFSKIKYTDGIAISSTVTAISDTLLIPANTFTGNTAFYIQLVATKTGTATNASIKIYANTTPTLTGATQIGACIGGSGGVFFNMNRTVIVKGATSYCFNPTVSSSSTITDVFASSQVGVLGSLAIDWSVNQYIIFAVTGAATEPIKTIFCSVKKL